MLILTTHTQAFVLPKKRRETLNVQEDQEQLFVATHGTETNSFSFITDEIPLARFFCERFNGQRYLSPKSTHKQQNNSNQTFVLKH
jgi:hypothetical protein